MIDYFILFITTMLVNNFGLIQFLGICPIISLSNILEINITIGLTNTIIATLASIVIWLINNFILVPYNLIHLRNITYILILLFFVKFIKIIINAINPNLYKSIAVFLPLIITNCAIFNILLTSSVIPKKFFQSILYNFSSLLGISLLAILCSSMHQKLMIANVPKPFKGYPIIFINMGIMSMVFVGFINLIKYI
ncbi:MAG: electron transport complex subunit RsxA [Pantoea sp. Brub]|nr:electron transport complex subunit RsxA [Pantoea sp. Brub]